MKIGDLDIAGNKLHAKVRELIDKGESHASRASISFNADGPSSRSGISNARLASEAFSEAESLMPGAPSSWQSDGVTAGAQAAYWLKVAKEGEALLEGRRKTAAAKAQQPDPGLVDVVMDDGILVAVSGLPEGYRLRLIDLDVSHCDEDEIVSWNGKDAFVRSSGNTA